MNESDLNKLREVAWRRKLTTEEETQLQTHLALHVEAQAAWEEEAALTNALRSLPKAPIASNFTAQVMQTLACERRAAERTASTAAPRLQDWWPRLSTRLAWAALLLLAGSSGLLYYRNATQQKEFASNVATVSTVAAVPGPDILQDFDAINQVRYASSASDEALIDFLR